MVAVSVCILDEILLVTLLGRIEGLRVTHLRDHFRHVITFNFTLIYQVLHFVDHFMRDFLLLLIMAKDDGSILRALIILLPIDSGWIMKNEQVPDKLLEGHLGRIESHMEHFHMPCHA